MNDRGNIGKQLPAPLIESLAINSGWGDRDLDHTS
jgi:hypothetical protein